MCSCGEVLEQSKVLEPIQHYATARSAAGLAILSLLSPIAGIAVEMAVARRFGTSAAVDAFRIALAVVYIGQQLFTSSFFPNIIVPLFAEYRANESEAEAWRSAIGLANLAVVPTSVVCLTLFASPSAYVWVLAPGLGPQARPWAIFFVRWFGLSLIPLLYSGAAIGLLYSQGVFWTGTAAQLAYNLVLVACILAFGGAFLGPASIAVGVLLATAAFMLLQFVKLAPDIRAMRVRRCWTRDDVVRAGVRKSIRAGVPLLGLPLINQGTAIVAFWSLSAASVGTIAALGYAGKLMRMASLLPDVIATVLFPKFAALARNSNPNELRELATRAMRMALFISLAIACTLFALRVPLVGLLFHHGAFPQTAVRRVGRLFGFFLIGMPAGILSFYLAKVLYALEDTWWPTCGGILSMVFARPGYAAGRRKIWRRGCSCDLCVYFLAGRPGTGLRATLQIRGVRQPRTGCFRPEDLSACCRRGVAGRRYRSRRARPARKRNADSDGRICERSDSGVSLVLASSHHRRSAGGARDKTFYAVAVGTRSAQHKGSHLWLVTCFQLGRRVVVFLRSEPSVGSTRRCSTGSKSCGNSPSIPRYWISDAVPEHGSTVWRAAASGTCTGWTAT